MNNSQGVQTNEEITEDLEDLLHTSMSSIVSLNDLVTELTGRLSHLALSFSDMQIEAEKRHLEVDNLTRELSEVKEQLKVLQDRQDGKWAEFGDWTECSAECGGTQRRTRTCTNPAPANGGADCEGEAEETRECNAGECEPYTMYITCDDYLRIYIDGAEKRPSGIDRWTSLSTLEIPALTTTIAVSCTDNEGGRHGACGIIGSVQDSLRRDIIATDSSWKCSDHWESGWRLPGFTEGSNWRHARDQGDGHHMLRSRDGGWKDIPSPNKRVIWGTTGVGTVYCRKTL